MKPLNDELRGLLKRKEPPEGFAERVLVRLEETPARLTFAERLSALWHRPALRSIAVGTIVCAMAVLGVVRYRHQQQMRVQAEQASREAILALRITHAELEAALQRAQRVTVQALQVPKNRNEKGDGL